MSLNSRRTEREREKDLGNSTIVSLISGSPPLPLPPLAPPVQPRLLITCYVAG